jgi:two-component system chemotaxis response regulator CheB
MKRVAVMIVEDSPVVRELIADALGADPRLTVACAVDSAEKALRLLPRMSPDVISMDIRLPGMDGIEATRRIMEDCPTPIIVLAADSRNETTKSAMQALHAGALIVVEKPSIESAAAYAAMARRLCDQFVNMSEVKVVRQRFNGGFIPYVRRVRSPSRSAVDVIGIVASTGGPAAVAKLLRDLGAIDVPPILIVQHMASNFIEGYASWLDSVSPLRVAIGHELEEPVPGRVYVAPGNCHLTYRAGQLRLTAAGNHGHVPSGDMLFGSLAAHAGARALGVLLTGMGDDGARGLLDMRRAGSHTIVQNQATSAVYGMPGAAWELGAACEQLPIDAIADRIAGLAGTPKREIKLIGGGQS